MDNTFFLQFWSVFIFKLHFFTFLANFHFLYFCNGIEAVRSVDVRGRLSVSTIVQNFGVVFVRCLSSLRSSNQQIRKMKCWDNLRWFIICCNCCIFMLKLLWPKKVFERLWKADFQPFGGDPLAWTSCENILLWKKYVPKAKKQSVSCSKIVYNKILIQNLASSCDSDSYSSSVDRTVR